MSPRSAKARLRSPAVINGRCNPRLTLLDIFIGRDLTSVRVREEEADIHNADYLDIRHDRRLLHSDVVRPSIPHSHRHRPPDCLFQGSHRYCKCSEQGKEPAIHEVTQLVLFRNDNVLSLWRKRNILLQAYRAGGQGLVAIRDTSSLHQLYALCNR